MNRSSPLSYVQSHAPTGRLLSQDRNNRSIRQLILDFSRWPMYEVEPSLFQGLTGLEYLRFHAGQTVRLIADDWDRLFHQNPRLETIEFDDSAVTNDVLRGLSVAQCKDHISLKSLVLSIDDSKPCPALETLIAGCSLQSLTIRSFTRIGIDNPLIAWEHRSKPSRRPLALALVHELATGLLSNRSLQSLTLSQGDFSECLSALACHPALTRLEVTESHLATGVELGRLLNSNRVLSSLSLVDCTFGETFCSEFCRFEWPNICRLEIDNLHHLQLGSLGPAIEGAPNLAVLMLGHPWMPLLVVGCGFVQRLRSQRLKHVYLRCKILDKDTASAMVSTVRENYGLREFRGVEFDGSMRHFRSEFDYFIKLNHSGRALLRSKDVPVGLWSLILGRLTNEVDADALYYFTRRKLGYLLCFGSSRGARKSIVSMP